MDSQSLARCGVRQNTPAPSAAAFFACIERTVLLVVLSTAVSPLEVGRNESRLEKDG